MDEQSASEGSCGPDFRHYPEEPYYLDIQRIDRPGDSSLLEIPATVQLRACSLRNVVKLAARRLGLRRGRLARAAYAYEWFRTAEMSADRLLRMLDRACRGGARHLMLSLHSSELMAGGGPRFRRRPASKRCTLCWRRLRVGGTPVPPDHNGFRPGVRHCSALRRAVMTTELQNLPDRRMSETAGSQGRCRRTSGGGLNLEQWRDQ